jgi:hypothetical protein
MNKTHIRVLTAKLNAGLLKQAAGEDVAAQRAADISRGKGAEAINRALGGVDPRLLLGGIGALGGATLGALASKKKRWLKSLIGGIIGGGIGAGAGVGYKAWADRALEKARAAQKANDDEASAAKWAAFGKGAKEFLSDAGKLTVKSGKSIASGAKSLDENNSTGGLALKYAINPAWGLKGTLEAMAEDNPNGGAAKVVRTVKHPIAAAEDAVKDVTKHGSNVSLFGWKPLKGIKAEHNRGKNDAAIAAKAAQVQKDLELSKGVRTQAQLAMNTLPVDIGVDNTTGRKFYMTESGNRIYVDPEATDFVGRGREWFSGWLQRRQNKLSDILHSAVGGRLIPYSKDSERINLSKEQRAKLISEGKLYPRLDPSLANIAINDPALANKDKARAALKYLTELNKQHAKRQAENSPSGVRALINQAEAERAANRQALEENRVDVEDLRAKYGF